MNQSRTSASQIEHHVVIRPRAADEQAAVGRRFDWVGVVVDRACDEGGLAVVADAGAARPANELDVNFGDICLVACHVWDTLGALAAGWQAGLILREGNAPLDLGPQPNYIGADLDAIADQLIARYRAVDATAA